MAVLIWFGRKTLCQGTWRTLDLESDDLHHCTYPRAHTSPCLCECGAIDAH